MITLWLKRSRARAAYQAAQTRDSKEWQLWCSGDRRKHRNGTYMVDVTQARMTAAWRRMMDASDAYQDALDQLNGDDDAGHGFRGMGGND